MGSFHSPRISWLQSVAMILITVIGTLLILGSGGGGGGGTTGGSDSGSEDGGGSFPAAIESAALDRETGQHPKSINVNFQLNHLRNGPFVSAISHIDESHEATRIVLTERTIVRQLRWSGIHFNGVEYGITGGKKLFNIRVFRDVMGLPADQAFIDIFVNAEVEDLGTIDGVDKKYKFSITNNDLFTLSSGSYWVAILDASENLSRFSWSVEQDSETTLYGNGGAFRDTEDDDWIASSAPQVTDATQSRGRSLAVYGEPTSLTNLARGIHYFTGYSESFDFYYPHYFHNEDPAYNDGLDIQSWSARDFDPVPIYFIGIYGAERQDGIVTIYVEDQPVNEIKLGLSSYNGVEFRLVGPGADSITTIYTFSYDPVTVTGVGISTVIERYSFSQGNYVGVLHEWESSSIIGVSRLEHEQTKTDVQNLIGGPFTYFMARYGGNEFRIHSIVYP